MKLVLLKLPKELSIESLEGVHVDLTKSKMLLTRGPTVEYNLTLDANDIDTVRPLVHNASDESGSVGSSFSQVITVSSKHYKCDDLKLDIEIPEMYQKIPQKSGLKVRTLPIGSLTDIDILWKKCIDTEIRQHYIKAKEEVIKSSKKTKADVLMTSPNNEKDNIEPKKKKKKIEKDK